MKMENQTATNPIDSNEKRLQSLKQLKKAYQNQKSIVQSALSNIDKRSNKIIFDDIDLGEPANNLKAVKQGHNIFHNDSDEDNFQVDFSVKKQFEGEKGQKLIELQSRYKNDKRFVLSERFLEDTTEDTVIENGIDQDEDEEMSLEKEKKREFEILDQVLQKHQIKPKLINEKRLSESKFMVRFDPSQPQHTKYEIKEVEPKKRKKEKTKNTQGVLETKKSEETEAPEVSKNVFYQVKGNLKDTLHANNQVSLLSMFGNANDNGYEDIEKDTEDKEIQITKPNLANQKNPFKYDSSDDEEEIDNFNKQDTTQMTNATAHKEVPTNRTNCWVETFFFKKDDYRLQDGFDFIEKMKLEDKSEFSKSRRELKEIVKNKIRNIQQKKKLFKRKLGGSKRRQKNIRIKKALKK